MSQTEVARIRGRRATPSSLEKRRERHKANASFFAFRARGGWRGRAFRCRGRARSWPSRVDAPFRFRASGEHVPYGLVLFLRVEGRGRHDVTDRAKRRDARPEFSRVRSDSLPAGQPSRVRWGPSAPPLQELRATGRGPSRERADAVRGRTLRRPRFPGATMRRQSLSAKQVPRTDPYAPQSSNLHKGTFCRFSRNPLVHTFGIWMSKRNASSERNEHRGVGFSSRHSRRRRDR